MGANKASPTEAAINEETSQLFVWWEAGTAGTHVKTVSLAKYPRQQRELGYTEK